jgi:hypothetical protein
MADPKLNPVWLGMVCSCMLHHPSLHSIPSHHLPIKPKGPQVAEAPIKQVCAQEFARREEHIGQVVRLEIQLHRRLP